MATAANTRRSWLRPRFSLRALLLAFTAFAIGFPIWYRWPYEEVEQLGLFKIDIKIITTWQRQWGGGRLKHGPEQEWYSGKLHCVTTYRNGRKHGPYIYYGYGSPTTPTIGQYADGEEDGVWKSADGDKETFTTFRNGQPIAQTHSPLAP